MKKIVVIALLLCTASAFAQTTLGHGLTMNVALSDDKNQESDFGVFQSGRIGYSAEITHSLSRELYIGGLAQATLGMNIREFPKVGEPEYDAWGNQINESENSLDNFFTNLIEANFKITPVFGYKLQPYRLPAYYTFSLLPITVATDFGLSGGAEKSTSVYFGTGLEIGIYSTQGSQNDFNGVALGFDFKWQQLEDAGYGFNENKGYWGLDITISLRDLVRI